MDEYDMFGNMENANRLNIIHIKLIKRAKKNLHIKQNSHLPEDSREIDLSQVQAEKVG